MSNRITDQELYDDAPYGTMGPEERSRVSHRSTLAGVGLGVAVALLLGGGALWAAKGSFAFGVASPAYQPLPMPVQEVAAVTGSVTQAEVLASSGALEIDVTRIYVTTHALNGTPLGSGLASDPAAGSPASVRLSRSVPVPMANPLFAARGRDGDGLKALQEMDLGIVPLPQRNPLPRDQRLAYAPLPDAATEAPGAPSAPALSPDAPAGDEVAIPTPGSGYALYDITGKVVYMPSGEKLEAHSGYGDTFDDIRAVHRRMVGPTPPNTYALVMRESLFHGVEAVRMNPVGSGKMFGRAGILVHPYLLGPRGDSNGCVSVKDYDRFLAAFKRGEVKKMVVVAKLQNAPKEPQNFLLSFLKPR